MKTLRKVNGTGIGLAGEPKDWLEDIRIYEENGSVQLWVEMRAPVTEAMQYLTAREAMALGLTLQRLATDALKTEAEVSP